MEKECIKCNIKKDLSEFTFRKDNNTFHNTCKKCKCNISKKNYLLNKEKKISYQKEYYLLNKEKCLLDAKKWSENNREKSNLIKKEHKKKNLIKYNLKRNESRKLRKQNDPLFKLKEQIRVSINKGFKKQNFNKPLITEKILGCSFKEFKLYIESKFESWMTWENHGNFNKEKLTWQIDHIIPISLAKTKEEIIKLNHFTNLQPLETKKNLYKSNKINYICH